jgi:ATP-dependent Lhr-like helicase
MKALELFHPVIKKWFLEKLGKPTSVQESAWPVIARGSHVLISAPTGSGKTLTAFLWALHQLITGKFTTGNIRVLYVSPLKALNNDMKKNLLSPLAQLKNYFAAGELKFPEITVAVRSGDTPPEERRSLLRRPPGIFITTPESLNILLATRAGQQFFGGVCTVILDEIHALVGEKRGTHLITAVERLVLLGGEFQRIALSATVRPLEVVADFIGGYRMQKTSAAVLYKKREVEIVKAAQSKKYRLSVCYPAAARESAEPDTVWDIHAAEFRKRIAAGRSTLLFANSRKTAERVARLINTQEGEIVAYSHHGSLSREIRLAVEEKLKKGELKAIVATSSLELGIDIGELDQVILIQTPRTLSGAVQRIGRAGHGVGEASAGIFYPMSGRELVLAAVSAQGILGQEIEETRPVLCPLDILAQVVLSMTSVKIWNSDELYDFIRTCFAYHELTRTQYDLVLAMLAGRFADTPIRELKARLSLDKIDNTLQAKQGVPFLLYLSGGTIPDRGYYNLRLQASKAKIGELDEEFVWERNIGDTFALGVQAWRIQRITHNDVEVVPADKGKGMIPFWRAEPQNRDFYFSDKILAFLEKADAELDNPAFALSLEKEYCLEKEAAAELIRYLKQQKQVTGCALPHRRHLVMESYSDPFNTSDSKQVILHTLWGGRVNRPFALALAQAWEEEYHYPLEIFVDDDCLLINLPHQSSPELLFALVKPESLEALLRKRLESSGFFAALFRENAGRALLLPKASFNRRMPLWINRLRSQKLFKAVRRYQDFPLLVETWRQSLKDEFDLSALASLLNEVAGGEIAVSQVVTQAPSPFAGNIIWRQTNRYMYEDDTPAAGTGFSLSEGVFKEVISSTALRPRFSEELICLLERKIKRTEPGYVPLTARDLLDWITERLAIPEAEWQELRLSFERDASVSFEELSVELGQKLAWITFPQAGQELLVAVENLPRIRLGFGLDLAELKLCPLVENSGQAEKGLKESLASMDKAKTTETEREVSAAELVEQFLGYYGPFSPQRLKLFFGFSEQRLEELLNELLKTERFILDLLRAGSDTPELCLTENVERLLRLYRLKIRPQVEARPLNELALFLAACQGVALGGKIQTDLESVLERLFGFAAPAGAWEEYIFPARLQPYYQAWLDSIMQQSDLLWLGLKQKQLSFCFPEDCTLFRQGRTAQRLPLPDQKGRFSLLDIASHLGSNTEEAGKEVWRLVWQGALTNDTFEVIRRGILNNFSPQAISEQKSPGRSRGYLRWRATRPLKGNWYMVPQQEEGVRDPLFELEMQRQRVRQLLDRYGLIFKELIARELPELRWPQLFRTLRLMELSGEIFSGHFFEDIPGLQFTSAAGLRLLKQELPRDTVFWLNACDPASLCGIALEGLKGAFPRRLPTTYLVFHDTRLVLSMLRNGKALEIQVEPAHPQLSRYFSIFSDLLTREFNPLKAIKVESINGKTAMASGYKNSLLEFGFREEYKAIVYRKKYG